MKLPTGKGMFLWQIGACEDGDTAAIIAEAQWAGLGHLLVKFADGRQQYQPQGCHDLVAAAHAAGIEVWGWPYIYGHDPAGEATAEAEWFAGFGFDGFVIDAESEYQNSPVAARSYMDALRAVVPDASVALSSFWWRSRHEDFPWHEFLDQCDFIMPQVYYSSAKVSPSFALETCLSEFAPFGLPIVPTAGDVDDPAFTGPSLTTFLDVAEHAGCPAFNVWHWQGAGSDVWGALRGAPDWGADDVGLKVVGPTGQVIDCGPNEAGGVTTCALRPLVEGLGWRVLYRGTPQPTVFLLPPGKPIPAFSRGGETGLIVIGGFGQPINCVPRFSGDTVRCDLRPVVRALGFDPFYRQCADGRTRIYLKPTIGFPRIDPATGQASS